MKTEVYKGYGRTGSGGSSRRRRNATGRRRRGSK